jgi:hypothetical protein
VVAEVFHRAENAKTYTFNKEDHTLGNLLRMQLLKDSTVKFSGYKMPHRALSHVTTPRRLVASPSRRPARRDHVPALPLPPIPPARTLESCRN